jgi:D-alanyl-lipoteichoic acid acyltransferase DltB (MBOAT superfamily)
MALAVALLFNIKLPINFNSPYKALDIQDFWRRWHITLSRFLRDYIYIPLGGNRSGELRTYSNLFTVFLVGGLWHGASWMFVIWGALHGSAIVIHRAWKSLGLRMNKYLAWFITFNFINITWIFFRAKDWESALKVLGGMIGTSGIKLHHNLNIFPLNTFNSVVYNNVFCNSNLTQHSLIMIFISFLIIIFLNNTSSMQKVSLSSYAWLYTAFFFSIDFFNLQSNVEFLYFNF